MIQKIYESRISDDKMVVSWLGAETVSDMNHGEAILACKKALDTNFLLKEDTSQRHQVTATYLILVQFRTK